MSRSTTESARPLITVEGLNLGYGSTIILSDVSFTIERGDFIALVGPNGSGKTTLLRALLGLIRPIAGSITINDSATRVGYVPQRQSLEDGWPLRAIDIVVMGLYDRIGTARRPRAPHRAAAARALAYVGMADAAERPFSALSGGQKQRVLLARALAGEPSMLLLDEPTAGMDIVATSAVLELLARLHRQGLTILLVSHQINDVSSYVPRLGLFTAGGFQIGPASEMLTDAKLSALYGTPIHVLESEGKRLVFPSAPPAAEGLRTTGPHGVRRA